MGTSAPARTSADVALLLLRGQADARVTVKQVNWLLSVVHQEEQRYGRRSGSPSEIGCDMDGHTYARGLIPTTDGSSFGWHLSLYPNGAGILRASRVTVDDAERSAEQRATEEYIRDVNARVHALLADGKVTEAMALLETLRPILGNS